MAPLRFNPITYSHKLQEAGISQKAAEVQAEELSNFINNDIFTKQDGDSLKNELRIEIKELELRMQSFMLKATTFTVGLLGGLQILFHFIK